MKKINLNMTAGIDIKPIMGKANIGKLEQFLSWISAQFIKSKPIIAVIRLSGVIGKVSHMQSGLTLEILNEVIEKAFKIKKLTAICLIINSPGGAPVQAELIAKRIKLLADEKQIKIYSFIEDVAASGGYWLACIGSYIYASKSSIIGSIGVISSGFGFQEAISKIGIERRVYSEGKNKSILDPFQPVNKNDIKIIKNLQKQIHEHFIEYVKERRAGRLTQSDDILFNGEFWSGQTAVDYGLIDGIGDMYNVMQKKYGTDTKFQYIGNKQSWFKRKLGLSSKTIAQEFADSLLDSVENKITQSKFKMD